MKLEHYLIGYLVFAFVFFCWYYRYSVKQARELNKYSYIIRYNVSLWKCIIKSVFFPFTLLLMFLER